MHRKSLSTLIFLVVLLSLCPRACDAQSHHWVASWAASASPCPDLAQMRKDGLVFENQTLREIVHLSLGGSQLRVRFSNLYGREALKIGGAHLALRSSGASIHAASDRALTFAGKPSVSISPNAFAVSDPVSLSVSDGSDLAISIFLPGTSPAAGVHYLAQQTSYVGPGDSTSAEAISNPRTLEHWIFLAGVDVDTPASVVAVAMFGDSRIDGDGSTPNTNHRWPDVLAKRLSNQGIRLGVVNAGISGNRILRDAPEGVAELGEKGLARFTRDALDQPGVKHVIVLEGIVDIGTPGTSFAAAGESVSVDELIAGLKQLAERAHSRGCTVFVATQTPFRGADFIPGIFTPAKEAQRNALNDWIRSSHAFDAVIDFDKVIRDPKNPDKILAAFDSGDHIHPNDAGYEAMANSVELNLFR